MTEMAQDRELEPVYPRHAEGRLIDRDRPLFERSICDPIRSIRSRFSIPFTRSSGYFRPREQFSPDPSHPSTSWPGPVPAIHMDHRVTPGFSSDGPSLA